MVVYTLWVILLLLYLATFIIFLLSFSNKIKFKNYIMISNLIFILNYLSIIIIILDKSMFYIKGTMGGFFASFIIIAFAYTDANKQQERRIKFHTISSITIYMILTIFIVISYFWN
ncbi:hypothetical protein CW357_17785 [Rummeliibacillus sp. TYF005]|nr:hypothetical protein CW357_17785 [Rummeliibacillus sp. TYF005]